MFVGIFTINRLNERLFVFKHFSLLISHQKCIALGAIGGSFISVNNPKIPAWPYRKKIGRNWQQLSHFFTLQIFTNIEMRAFLQTFPKTKQNWNKLAVRKKCCWSCFAWMSKYDTNIVVMLKNKSFYKSSPRLKFLLPQCSKQSSGFSS